MRRGDGSKQKTRSQRFWEWYTNEYMRNYFSVRSNLIGLAVAATFIAMSVFIQWIF